jgi:hypothetical protein
MSSEPFWTPERDAERVRLRLSGMTATEVARLFGITRGAVLGREYREKHRAEIGAGGTITREDVLAGADAGLSARTLAERHRVAISTVWKLARRMGVRLGDGRQAKAPAVMRMGRVRPTRAAQVGHVLPVAKRPEAAAPKPQTAKPEAAPVPEPAAPIAVPDSKRLNFLDLFGTVGVTGLGPVACRWPEGEGATMTFCGHDAAAGKPYCSAHGAKAMRREVLRPMRAPRDDSVQPVRRAALAGAGDE